MSPKSPRTFQLDEINQKLIAFAETWTRKAWNPIKVPQFVEEMKKKTLGNHKDSILESRTRHMLTHVEDLDLNTEAKVRMLVFLSYPVSKTYKKILQGLGTLKWDKEGRITFFQQRGWEYPIHAVHDPSKKSVKRKQSGRITMPPKRRRVQWVYEDVPENEEVKKMKVSEKKNDNETENITPEPREPMDPRRLIFNPIEIPPHERSAQREEEQKEAQEETREEPSTSSIIEDEDIITIEDDDDDIICISPTIVKQVETVSLCKCLNQLAVFVDHFQNESFKDLHDNICDTITAIKWKNLEIPIANFKMAIEEHAKFLKCHTSTNLLQSEESVGMSYYFVFLCNFTAFMNLAVLIPTHRMLREVVDMKWKYGKETLSKEIIKDGLQTFFEMLIADVPN